MALRSFMLAGVPCTGVPKIGTIELKEDALPCPFH